MKINHIALYNFGSYEGEAYFDTHISGDRNIILVGGKNGAGKTTLFTAMRVCLYGYMSMGYRSQNSFYKRAITKMINNNAKINRPTNAHVSMEIALSSGRDIDIYHIIRAWELSDSLAETFTVNKNGEVLTQNEVADFQKYLLSLIPPELFNLYFFDGEKIVDFFLNEGSNERIKEAFLTLCGYDTFDIMRKNFRRVGATSRYSPASLDEYISSKEAADHAKEVLRAMTDNLQRCIDEIGTCEADIVTLEKSYSETGGISQDEWDQKIATLKEEEKKRESWNALLKKWANDMIPFLMIREQVAAVKAQMEKENDNLKYRNFCEVLETPSISAAIAKDIEKIKKIAFTQFGTDGQQILKLSFEQSSMLLSQINHILEFETEKIEKVKRTIKRSISLSSRTRQELDNSNVVAVQEYMRRRAELFERKSILLMQCVELEKNTAAQTDSVQLAEATLSKAQARLEDDLKKASINDISARAIVMLDKLQDVLYQRQIRKAEEFFRKEISMLMRKSCFIDDIRIDNNFNTHIYRTESFKPQQLIDAIMNAPAGQLEDILGSASMHELKRIAGSSEIPDIISFCQSKGEEMIYLPVEIDKMSLSNGEKQIFIMALYHSLIRLCSHEIPYVIDTPFARIDTEHRRNISLHFFCKLKGQVFILSTNEEIDSDHVGLMRDNIATTYMLENSSSQRTEIVKDSYFEV